ncbi:TPA: DEAD/DEAH box helicase, partial [Legionella pneumophila]|nr:DEAD/DEAH box helicase [Legionella pneumophila]
LTLYVPLGFASWLKQSGMIEYVDNRNPEESEFFVPRVIQKLNLGRKKGERLDRFFPEKNDGQAIALYLGLKLVSNGSIAIFCGRKSTAASICKKAVDIIGRELPFSLPSEFSNLEEVQRLTNLHIKNLGIDSPFSQCAAKGIFFHHGNTPHGVRLAVEHAMRDNLVRFVVCTSTLAQGVNLPIRYLIVTSLYQGMDHIKTRDFHNLIGRAGRAGMHTEGSILFADPVVYDKRLNRREGWRWHKVKELLDPTKSEECASSLFQLIPLIIYNDKNKSEDKKHHKLRWNTLSFAKAHIKGWDALDKTISKIAAKHFGNGFTIDAVKRQFEFFSHTLSSIEGFLFSNWEIGGSEPTDINVMDLAKQTFAYYLADVEKKKIILDLFKLLAKNISEYIHERDRRIAFGKTLYGINDSIEIEKWVQVNADKLVSAITANELIDLLWPLILKHVHNNAFKNFNNKDVLRKMACEWMSGTSFYELFRIADKSNCRLGEGKGPRKVKIENIIDICEGGFAYDGSLILNSLCVFFEMLDHEKNIEVINKLQIFQKSFKYGLPTETTIALYEIGFSDRVICQDLASSLNLIATKKKDIVTALQQDPDRAYAVIEKYPSYFLERMNELFQR